MQKIYIKNKTRLFVIHTNTQINVFYFLYTQKKDLYIFTKNEMRNIETLN